MIIYKGDYLNMKYFYSSSSNICPSCVVLRVRRRKRCPRRLAIMNESCSIYGDDDDGGGGEIS
jgi:hypothetical protein